MGRIIPHTAREIVRILERHGFQEKRQTGSHKFMSKGDIVTIVPMHSGDVPLGTLRAIIKQSKLDPALFEA